ncbi:MAG TPA: polysaccharide deacetylase family protein, partial [Gemmatimonadaceae bacterium]|nr:polysaccharide deacetylase family protein [Gemmatimonadaceae bacterium]
MMPELVGAAATATGLWSYATFYRNSALYGSTLGRLPGAAGSAKQIALTFDDGPNAEATPRILDTLARENVPATFFLLGRHVEKWPQLAKRVADERHGVGNHGWFHKKLHLRGPGYVRLDLELGTDAIQRATGVAPTCFRAPHGFRSPWVSSIARELGQRTIGWTLGVWDSARPGAEEIARRSIDATRPGTILLLHDGDGYDPAGDRTQTAEALPIIIRGLRARGFDFVQLPA